MQRETDKSNIGSILILAFAWRKWGKLWKTCHDSQSLGWHQNV